MSPTATLGLAPLLVVGPFRHVKTAALMSSVADIMSMVSPGAPGVAPGMVNCTRGKFCAIVAEAGWVGLFKTLVPASDRLFLDGDVVLKRVTEFLNENLRWTSTT